MKARKTPDGRLSATEPVQAPGSTGLHSATVRHSRWTAAGQFQSFAAGSFKGMFCPDQNVSTMRRLKLPLIVFALIATLSALASRWLGLGFWATAAILSAALLANGLVAMVEDDVPGGFNNPDGTSTPRYVFVLKWIGRGFVAIAVLGCVALAALFIRNRM